MRASLDRCWTWLSPAVAIAALAALGGGVAEAVAYAPDARVGLVGAGEGGALIVPALTLAQALVRAIWHGWRGVVREPRRGPEVLAGLLYGALAVLVVLGAGYLAARHGQRATRLAWLAALIAGAGAAGAVAGVLALSRPAVRGLARMVARAWPAVTPGRALAVAAAVVASLLVAAWLAARPLLVRYDLGLAAYGTGFAAGAALAIGVVVARPARVRGLALLGALATVAGWAGARGLAAAEPTALLDAWSQLPIGGRCIEARHTVGHLRARVVAAIPAPAPRQAAHPDVLLITIDSLRADRLTPALMPAVSALGEAGAWFERAYAPSTVTRRSLSAIMTSRSPGRVRGRLIDFALKLDPRHVLLAERFARAGYITRGFLCCAHHFGGALDLGLDRGLARVVYDRDGEHLARAAQSFFLDPAADGAPRFAWLHTYEPHNWHTTYPAALYGGEPGPRYDRTATDVDRALAPLLEAIRARGRPTLIVITADHGEGLGEHGVPFHAGAPYVSQLHVPLVVHGPGIAPRRVAAPVGLIGLGDTLLDLAGFAPPPSDGPSFAGLVTGDGPGPDEIYASLPHDRLIKAAAHALIVGAHQLIEVDGRAPELYDLSADPGQLTDLAARQPERLAELRRRLARHRAHDRLAPF